MPRGFCYHHNSVDNWTGSGGSYNYTREKPTFDDMMNKVQTARMTGTCTVGFLKEILKCERR